MAKGIKKSILVIGQEAQIIKATTTRLRDNFKYRVNHKRLSVPLRDLLDKISYLCKKNKGGFFDLVILLGYRFKTRDEFINATQIIERSLRKTPTNILFIVDHPKFRTRARVSRVEISTFEEIFIDSTFIDVIDKVLDLEEDEQSERIRIADHHDEDRTLPEEKLSDVEAFCIDEMSVPHVCAIDEVFIEKHVEYDYDQIETTELKSDRALDPEYRHLNSIDEFDKVLRENPARVTHLLIGHRGCGKTSFIHYYFRKHPKFEREIYPYIIVDYINYGALIDEKELPFNIIRSLYSHFHKYSITELTDQYKDISQLFPPDIVTSVLDFYQDSQIDYNEVISAKLKYEIENSIGGVGHVDLGREIEGKSKLNQGKARKISRDRLKTEPWVWLKYLWLYINKDSKERPFRYFVDWVLKKSFEKSHSIRYSNYELFCKGMAGWKREYYETNKRRLGTLTLYELEDILNSFLDQARDTFGRIFLAIDNVDMLGSSIAEFRIMRNIYGHIAGIYEKLKIVFAIRPGTHDIHSENLKRIMEVYTHEDTKTYYKRWLQKVSLQKVLEKRIDYLIKHPPKDVKEEFLINLMDFINYPIHIPRRKRDKNKVITSLISGVTGNNVRDGLELFCDMLKTKHDKIEVFKRNGFLRKSSQGKTYIADYIATRAIFLENDIQYKFRDGLVNLFYVSGVTGYESTLIQIRILEVLLRFKKITFGSLLDKLKGLGYKKKNIIAAINQLRWARLLSIYPQNVDLEVAGINATVYFPYRGTFYYDHLINRLSYIQMVYFMIPLPQRYVKNLSYPKLPKVRNGELRELVKNFLEALYQDIGYERKAASKEAIMDYERRINKLRRIHNQVIGIYYDLESIERGLMKVE